MQRKRMHSSKSNKVEDTIKNLLEANQQAEAQISEKSQTHVPLSFDLIPKSKIIDNKEGNAETF